jgi:uncharacterized oligopeptide transporter (OPT) family protein
MTLPPYAMAATIIGALFVILIALLEIKGPGKLKKYLPSVAGLGIGWLVAGYDSIAMGVGAIGAWIFLKVSPKNEDRYNVAISSGIIAGSSLMSLTIILLTVVVGVLAMK